MPGPERIGTWSAASQPACRSRSGLWGHCSTSAGWGGMKLYVERGAVIEPAMGAGPPLATVCPFSLMRDCDPRAAVARASAAKASLLVVGGTPRGSSIGSEDFGPAWMSRAAERVERSVAAWEAASAGAGPRLCVWPHSNHPVSDVPSILRFTRGHPRWGFVLDPVAMLTVGMLRDVEDHLTRIFEHLESHAGAAAVVLTDAAQEGDHVRALPLRPDSPSAQVLISLWRRHCPASLPVVLLETDFGEQAALLGCPEGPATTLGPTPAGM